MHIAVDCRYIRERPSGIGCYAQALVDRLPREAPADRFLFWAHRLAARPLSSAPNVREHTVPVEPSSLWTILWPNRHAPFDGIDVFHVLHNILPRNVACATVVTVHDLMSIELPGLHRAGWDGLVKRLYYPQSVWRALRAATRVVTTTGAMADRVLALCPQARGRTVVVPLAADEAFRPAADGGTVRRRVATLVGSENPYMVVVGQSIPTKRHAVALAAFAQGAPPPWRLVLLQRQTVGHPLAALARRLRVDDRVVWLQGLAQPDLVALLQGAGALLQPSSYEGFGLPIVEAMACGCPVVASDLPTIREVAGEAALLVRPDDVAGFARAVESIARTPTLGRELGDRGRERATVFSWDRCARETLAVYRAASADRWSVR